LVVVLVVIVRVLVTGEEGNDGSGGSVVVVVVIARQVDARLRVVFQTVRQVDFAGRAEVHLEGVPGGGGRRVRPGRSGVAQSGRGEDVVAKVVKQGVLPFHPEVSNLTLGSVVAALTAVAVGQPCSRNDLLRNWSRCADGGHRGPINIPGANNLLCQLV